MDDWQLLNEYVGTGSESAFRSLVERHINLVHSVAMRHVRDADQAREVSQAVFILLAQKAGSMRPSVVLSAWLFRTTRFVAARALRSEQRRSRREQEAVRMQTLNYSPETVSRLAPVLDEALNDLSDKDRESLLLRFYEEQSLGQVGGRLGITEEAAKKRVSRALEKLRAAFARRGFGVSAAVVTTVLSEKIAEAAPASLANGIASAAMASTSKALPALVHQVLQAWRWAKIRMGLGIGVAIVATFFVIREIASRDSIATHNDAVATILPSDIAKATTPAVGATLDNPRGARPFLFKVVDIETGAAIASAEIHARYWSGPGLEPRDDLVTGADGVCAVPLPEGELGRLDLGIIAPGYVQKFFTWWPSHFGPLPRSYTFKVERGVSIGGFVRDPAGRPVANASIVLHFPEVGESDSRERKPERLGFFEDLAVATTDANGRWQCANLPPRYNDFSISVKHTDFPNRQFQVQQDNPGSAEGLSIAELYAGKAVLTFRPGLTLSGLVEDEQGKPIAGAKICVSRWADPKRPAAVTDTRGNFRVAKLTGPVPITVVADGYAPERSANVDPSQTPIRIQLKPASVLRIRVVDSSGQPVPQADVAIEEWREHGALELREPTDNNGVFEWRSAPGDALKVCILKPGYLISRNNEVRANGADQVITIRQQFRVTGRVVDAETGERLASFKAVPGYGILPKWDIGETTAGRDGQYDLSFSEADPPYSIRVTAQGYTQVDSTPMTDDPNPQSCDFELRRVDPEKAIQGTAFLPNGRPAANIDIAVCTIEKGVCIGQGRVARHSSARPIKTDPRGWFEFPSQRDSHTIIAVGPEGIGCAPLQGDAKSLQIRLQPWGRITGSVRLAAGSAGQRVQLLDQSFSRYGGGTSLDFEFSAISDAEGHFVIEQAPPGEYDLYIAPNDGTPFRHRTPILVKPDQTVEVQIGGSGQAIRGRFELADAPANVNWSNQIGFVTFQTSKVPPQPPGTLDRAALEEWKREFWQSEAGRALAREQDSIALQIGSDGSFVAENVKPGEYELTLQLYDRVGDRTSSNRWRDSKQIGNLNRKKIVITEASSDEPVDLGAILLTPTGQSAKR
jgi:RNA polymerase sigma factor (sigma-70 family)